MFTILASNLINSSEYVSERAILLRLTEFLLCESKEYKDIIKFENDIMIDKERNKGQQNCSYNK